MYNTKINIRASMFPANRVHIHFLEHLEVQLDCAECMRTMRTILFERANTPGRCCSGGHEFPARLSLPTMHAIGDSDRRITIASYELNYQYSEFVDNKYDGRLSNRLPSWGRAHLRAECPHCSLLKQGAVQNNDNTCVTRCACGSVLYETRGGTPEFTLLEPQA
jgi:ribosomal protein S27E